MLYLLFRFVFYVLFTFTLAHIISLEGFSLGIESQYSEYSLTENLQTTFILSSALLFWLAAQINKQLKPVSIGLFALMLMMFIRESDIYLDKFVFDGAWQTLVSIVLLSTAWYLWRVRTSINSAVVSYSHSMSNGFLMCGLVVTLVFSRLMGRGVFWQSVMGEQYVYFRSVKNIVEESTELLGYSLILFAALELLILCVLRLKKGQSQTLKIREISLAN
ncbi:hypothetical protein CBF23_005860 [Marinomonas agarivorans]|nr:hypothetical protein CBF23_005860 [Marinomonas agarivorans]